MCFWTHPYSTLLLGVFPLHQIAYVGVSKRIGLKLFGREIIFKVFQTVWKTYLNATDGRTDGRTDDMQTDSKKIGQSLFRDHLALQHWMPTFQTIPGMSLRIIIPGPLVGTSVGSDGIICADNPLQCHEVMEQRSSTFKILKQYN